MGNLRAQRQSNRMLNKNAGGANTWAACNFQHGPLPANAPQRQTATRAIAETKPTTTVRRAPSNHGLPRATEVCDACSQLRAPPRQGCLGKQALQCARRVLARVTARRFRPTAGVPLALRSRGRLPRHACNPVNKFKRLASRPVKPINKDTQSDDNASYDPSCKMSVRPA